MLMPRQTPGLGMFTRTVCIQYGVTLQYCTPRKLESCAARLVECERICDSLGRQAQVCTTCRSNLGVCQECLDSQI